MTKHTLAVSPRQVSGRQVKTLRAAGQIPANVFGKGVASKSIQAAAKELSSLLKQVGESTLLYLQITGEKEDRPTLISEILTHPVTGDILHVSFHQVDLKQKVVAKVTIHLEGAAPAEKDGLGILVQQLDEVEIEALPTDMPEGLTVDISGLTEVNQSIFVKDLSVDTSKLTIKSDPEAIIVRIEPLAKEEVEEKPVTDVGAVEGAVPAEGEAAPATASPAAPAEGAKEEKK